MFLRCTDYSTYALVVTFLSNGNFNPNFLFLQHKIHLVSTYNTENSCNFGSISVTCILSRICRQNFFDQSMKVLLSTQS